MTGFPLTDLHSTLLGRIACKLHSKSYARFQQTCRGMAELVRTNQNVTAHVGQEAFLEWETQESGTPVLTICIDDGLPIDLESVYGARFLVLYIQQGIEEDFEAVCTMLKKYRISAEHLDMYNEGDRARELSKEQCAEVFKILKPCGVSMDTMGTDRFEALSVWKGVKTVNLDVLPEDVLSALRIVSQCSHVFLTVKSDETMTCVPEQYFNTLEGILQFLQSESLSHLRVFRCHLTCDEQLPPVKEQHKRLIDFNLTFLEEQSDRFLCGVGDITITGNSLVNLDQYRKLAYECKLGQTRFELTLDENGSSLEYFSK